MASLRKDIYEAKRKCFHYFIGTMNYRTDSKKVFKFVNNLKSNPSPAVKIIFTDNQKILTGDKNIANGFISFYSKSQKLNRKCKGNERLLKRNIHKAVIGFGPHQSVFHPDFT